MSPVWIEPSDNGQYLNVVDMVERFSLDAGNELCILNAHMPSGEVVPISTRRDFSEGSVALRKLIDSALADSE